jgi:phage/plasmid-associated DNA primase
LFLEGNVKNVQNRIQFINTTKGIYDINNLPLISTYMDKAFFRRFQIIHFPTELLPTEIIRNIMEKIVLEEGGAIISYLMSLRGLWDKYLVVDWEHTQKMWNKFSPSIFAFIDNYCDLNSDEKAYCDDVFDDYVKWCKAMNRLDVVNKNHMGKILKKMGVQKSRDMTEGSYSYGRTFYYMRCDYGITKQAELI